MKILEPAVYRQIRDVQWLLAKAQAAGEESLESALRGCLGELIVKRFERESSCAGFRRLRRHARWFEVPAAVRIEVAYLASLGYPSIPLQQLLDNVVEPIISSGEPVLGQILLLGPLPRLHWCAWCGDGLLRCWEVSAAEARAWKTRGSA